MPNIELIKNNRSAMAGNNIEKNYLDFTKYDFLKDIWYILHSFHIRLLV